MTTRREELAARHEELSKRRHLDKPDAAPPSRRTTPRRSFRFLWIIVILAAGLGIWWVFSGIDENGAQEQTISIPGYPISTGTGFFITTDGWLLTAAHVVAGGSDFIILASDGVFYRSELAAVDHANDVAVLKTEGDFVPLPFADPGTISLGASVFTIGFPLPDIQGQRPKLTRGDISSLAGIRDDPRHYQISVPAQPGNSGGPLVDLSGNLVGMIAMRLHDGAIMETVGIVPQNVNYALKTAYIRPLLDDLPRGANLALSSPSSQSYEHAVETVERAVVQVLVFGE